MAIKWIKTPHRGLRYYEHATRKHGKQRDRYYSIRFKVAGVDYTYGVGWMSDGVPEAVSNDEPGLGFQDYCLKQLRFYKNNVKSQAGPKSPKERRKEGEAREAAEREELELQERETVTVKDFFENSYLPQAKADKKAKSVTREESLFRLWISPTIGKKPMKNVTSFDVERIKRNMAEAGLTPRSVEYCLSVIRQIFNVARRFDVFTGENPTTKVRFPKPDNARMRFLTHDEGDRFLKKLMETSKNAHDQALLSLHCGLRFGEIAALTWQDVDLEQGILTIRDAKAGTRYAFLTDQARDMLKGRNPGNPQDLVFPGRLGRKQTMPTLTFRRVIDELGFNAGIDDPRLKACFHSLRHTYASWMIETGTDLYTLQRLLGHKTNAMTQRYSHLSENRLKDAAKALSRAIEENQTTGEGAEIVDFKP